jgi:hypothetical protein
MEMLNNKKKKYRVISKSKKWSGKRLIQLRKSKQMRNQPYIERLSRKFENLNQKERQIGRLIEEIKNKKKRNLPKKVKKLNERRQF